MGRPSPAPSASPSLASTEHWDGHYLEDNDTLFSRPLWLKDVAEDPAGAANRLSWRPHSWVLYSARPGHELLLLDDMGLHPPTGAVSTWSFYTDANVTTQIELRVQRDGGAHVGIERIALRLSVAAAKLVAERLALAGADAGAHDESIELSLAADDCVAVDCAFDGAEPAAHGKSIDLAFALAHHVVNSDVQS